MAFHLQDGVGHLPIGNDCGATLLCSAPSSIHLGSHAAATTLAFIPKLDIAVHLWAVCVDDPASQAESTCR